MKLISILFFFSILGFQSCIELPGADDSTFAINSGPPAQSGNLSETPKTPLDSVSPVLTLNGAQLVFLDNGEAYVELGADAIDDVDGDLSSQIVIEGTINPMVAQDYSITYRVSDSSGNSVTVNRTVRVRPVSVTPDITPPVLTLSGQANINIEVGSTYTESGATAVDAVDGDISGLIAISGVVDVSTIGTYQLRYNVQDSSGNSAAELVRTVTIVSPPPSPLLTSFFINFSSTSVAPSPWFNTQGSPSSGRVILGIADQNSSENSLQLEFLTNFSGSNGAGMQGSGSFPNLVMQESYYFNTGTMSILVSRLDPAKIYDFHMMASRNGSGDRTTIFSVGSNTSSINASFNLTDLAVLEDLIPNDLGEITLNIEKGPGASYGYINGLQIDAFNNPNYKYPPVIPAIANKNIIVDDTLTFDIQVTDPDGNSTISLVANDLPSFGTFNDLGNGLGRFSFSPLAAHAFQTTRVSLVGHR